MSVEQIRRVVDDTRGLPPRTLIRVFTGIDEFDESVRFYEALLGIEADGRFPFPAARLRLATVGSFLIIGGDDEALRPFRSTTGTILVDDVEPYYARAVEAGARIVFALQDVPTGRAFNAEFSDGTVVEFVHHRPS